MSFREKHLWASIAATLGVWGYYFWRLFEHIRDGDLKSDHFVGPMSGLFILCLVLVVVIEVSLTLVATWTSRQTLDRARREREMKAALQASHVALMVLMVLVMGLAVLAYSLGLTKGVLVGDGPKALMTLNNAGALMANILLFVVVLSELVRFSLTLALIRRRS
ncbi:MAG: hypothetical protein HZY74_04960 [Brevundimonas sp.]|nr:MAG: hypothetical protein HZY74_04960 [Brevundimonas sp.]